MLEHLPKVEEKKQLPGPTVPVPPDKKAGKNWRVARRIVVGLGTFVLINVLVLMLEPYFLNVVSYELNLTGEKILLYQQQPAPDIILMGSSRVENGLDPAIVEQAIAEKTTVRPRVLNLGFKSGSLELNYLILKNIIQDDKKPSVIVYGLSELELNTTVADNNYFESVTRAVPNSEVLFRPDDLARYGGSQLEQQAKFMLNQLVPLVRDQQLILKALNIQFNFENINHAAFLNQTEKTQNGYVPFRSFLNDPESDINAKSYKATMPDFKVQNADMDFFKAFLDLAKARGIKVVLINMPVSPILQRYWQDDNKIQLYRQTVQNFARENAVPLLDLYQDNSQFPQESFYDTNHLNIQGAMLISQVLATNYLADYFSPPENPGTDFYKSKLSGLTVPARLPDELTTSGSITIQNLSPYFWPTLGSNSIQISYHWLNADGSLYPKNSPKTELNYSFRPGETRTVRFTITTPSEPGQYVLQVDLVYGSSGWFSEVGAPTVQKPVTIEK